MADAGYLTHIADFSGTDAINDCEEYVACITNSSVQNKPPMITQEEQLVKMALMKSMLIMQKERYRQHSVIQAHGLTGLNLGDDDFEPVNSKKKSLNSLASLAPKEALDRFAAGLLREKKLREELQKLTEMRKLGVFTKIDKEIALKLNAIERMKIIKAQNFF